MISETSFFTELLNQPVDFQISNTDKSLILRSSSVYSLSKSLPITYSRKDFWTGKVVESIKNNEGYKTLKQALRSIKKHKDSASSKKTILCKHKKHLKTKMAAAAVEVERSWLMFSLGALLTATGVLGNIVAPGASNLLTGVGVGMMFGAPFIDGTVSLVKKTPPSHHSQRHTDYNNDPI